MNNKMNNYKYTKCCGGVVVYLAINIFPSRVVCQHKLIEQINNGHIEPAFKM